MILRIVTKRLYAKGKVVGLMRTIINVIDDACEWIIQLRRE